MLLRLIGEESVDEARGGRFRRLIRSCAADVGSLRRHVGASDAGEIPRGNVGKLA